MALTNLLKSIFISLFPTLSLWVSLHSFIRLTQGFDLSALGLCIMAMSIVILFVMIFLKKMARGYADLRWYQLMGGLGLLLLLAGYLRGGGQPMDWVWVLLLLLGWVAYTRWYSVFTDREKEVLAIGKPLPDFEVEDINQHKITKQDLLGHKSLLLFFRGNWCPLCMAQIKEVAKDYQQLEDLGVQTYLISPQPQGHSIALANKHQVNFKYLVDKDHTMAKRFHIFAENGLPMGLQVLGYDSDSVLPTVIVTDEQGKIIFADLTDNYRMRPEPSTFLDIIRQHR